MGPRPEPAGSPKERQNQSLFCQGQSSSVYFPVRGGSRHTLPNPYAPKCWLSHISDPCFPGDWDFCSPWPFLCIPYITPHVNPHHLPTLSSTHVDPTLKDPTVCQIRQAANNQLCARAADHRERNHAQCDLPKSRRCPWKDITEWSLDEEVGILRSGEAEA